MMLDRKAFRNRVCKFSFELSLIIVLCFSTLTLARYITGVYATDSGRVAKYSVTENIEDIPIYLGNLNEFNDYTYDFKVTNVDGNNIVTEVQYQYKIIIHTAGNIPLNIELYKNGDTNNLLNDALETDYLTMMAGSLQEDNFHLYIALGDSSFDASDLIDYLDIEIEALQID